MKLIDFASSKNLIISSPGRTSTNMLGPHQMEKQKPKSNTLSSKKGTKQVQKMLEHSEAQIETI